MAAVPSEAVPAGPAASSGEGHGAQPQVFPAGVLACSLVETHLRCLRSLTEAPGHWGPSWSEIKADRGQAGEVSFIPEGAGPTQGSGGRGQGAGSRLQWRLECTATEGVSGNPLCQLGQLGLPETVIGVGILPSPRNLAHL